MTERQIETVAVYKEDRVKVYGITEKTDLALAILSLPSDKLAQWGQQMVFFQETLQRFELVTCHVEKDGKIALHLLYDMESAKPLHKKIRQLFKSESETSLNVHEPVDVLFLFGPHFQDRFGIVDIGIRALMDNKIEILVSGCAGTSMYFVTPKGSGQRGVSILSETFLIPTTV